MASSSKRISELNIYSNVQFASGWQSAMVPANFYTNLPDYPDTYKVPMSSLALNFKDGTFSGTLSILKSLSANASFTIGSSTNFSRIFAVQGTSNSSAVTFELSPTDSFSSLILPIGKSWFFKAYVIGVSSLSPRKSTNIEFTGLIRHDNAAIPSNNVSIVGTPTKIIHSREDLTTDANVEADNTFKKLSIKVTGGSSGEVYNWSGRIDYVQY